MADDSYQTTTLELSGATSVAFSADETRIYVARPDGAIDVFDTVARAKITTWNIGIQLGGLSVSEDGSFLLVTELQPLSSMSVLYRVNTATGTFTSYTTPGQAFSDVEIVDADTAIITGGQTQVTRLDLTTGAFSSVANGVYYSNSSVLVEDRHLTLLAETGISNGPLALYDDRTDTIVARGDNYQSGASSGFNFGQTAVSEAAGLVAQFSYYQSINLFDLNLLFQRNFIIQGPVDGVAFDPTGTSLFVRHTDSPFVTGGPLAQYDVATGTLIENFALDDVAWSGGSFTGDQITFSDDGKTILVHDSSTGRLELIDLHARDQYFAGTAGADALEGGRGDDTYVVNNAGDTITELPFQGIDTVLASLSYTLGANLERLELSGSGIFGTGNALANRITGNALSNVLDGGTGADTLIGRGGDDTYFVDNAGDVVIEVAGEGVDSILASFSYALGAGSEVETLATTNEAGTAAIDLTGNEIANVIRGNAGNNVLNGGGGADSLVGFGGDDTYIVDNALDVIVEAANAGANDRVLASTSYTLGAGVYVELLATTADAGTSAINLSGNAFGNIIRGNAGNNILDGSGGADSMTGLGGDDWYYVDNAGDVVVETAGGGNDRIFASLGYTLAAGVAVEMLSTTDSNGTAALNFTGNAFNQVIFGNAGANVLTGGGGSDTLLGLAGNDTLVGNADSASTLQGGTGDDWYFVNNAGDSVLEFAGEGNDRVFAGVNYALSAGREVETLNTLDAAGTTAINLTGNAFNQVIFGNAGVNVLTGGGGSDTLLGLAGNDTLVGNADSASTLQGGTGDDWYFVFRTGDTLVEIAGEGNDRLFAGVSYTLSAGQAIETLSTLDAAGTAAINLTGNAFNQVIFGNAGANVLTGGGGSDTLLGLGGNDILVGNATTASTLQGGAGDDWYFVHRTGDSLVEFAGEGNDRLFAGVSYTLSAGQAIETLSTLDAAGTAAINLAGNELAQIVYGNAGANVLSGGGGNDTLGGLGGNDMLYGDAGEDLLNGGLGADVLDGGAGADILLFADTLGGGNVDSVIGFVSGQDRLFLENDVFAGLGTGVLAAGAFVSGSAAADADDRIVYDSATGSLWFDADGSGAGTQVLFATLTAGTTLTASDIVVI